MSSNVRISENHSPLLQPPRLPGSAFIRGASQMLYKDTKYMRHLQGNRRKPRKKIFQHRVAEDPPPCPLPIGRGVNSNEPIKQSLPPFREGGGESLLLLRADFRRMLCRV